MAVKTTKDDRMKQPITEFSIKSLRTILFIMLAITIVSVTSLSASEKKIEVSIGYQALPTAEIVLKEMGWLDQMLGKPFKWVRISSGVQGHRVLLDGTLDLALLGSSPVAIGITKGIPLEVIWIHDIIADNEALVVKADRGINHITDLKGKRVSAPFGSTTDYHLWVALMLNGLDPSQLQIVYLEPEEMFKAWQNDRIDAGFIWMPTLKKMIDSGGKILLNSRQLVDRGFPTGNLAVVRKDFGKRYPNIVVNYLRALDRTVKFCREQPEKAAAAVARQLNISNDEAMEQMKGVILLTAQEQDHGKYFGGTYWNFGLYTVLKETADFLYNKGVVTSLPPREAFLYAVNATFLDKVLQHNKTAP